MSDRVQGFNARDCGDWSRNPSRRPVVWAHPATVVGRVGATASDVSITVTMGPDGHEIMVSREDARALANYILALTGGQP